MAKNQTDKRKKETALEILSRLPIGEKRCPADESGKRVEILVPRLSYDGIIPRTPGDDKREKRPSHDELINVTYVCFSSGRYNCANCIENNGHDQKISKSD